MPVFTCAAILFDLDGVLVDSTPCVTRIWSAWAREHGLDPDYVIHVAHGQRTIETVRTVAPELDAEREMRDIEQRELNDTDGLVALPGAKQLLSQLPVNRCAVVTSGTRRLAVKRLQAVGLAVPEHMVTADDVTRGKPDPEPYLAGARLLGIDPRDAVIVEDAPSGIRAGKAAGATVIALPTTYPAQDLKQSDLVIRSLEQIELECEPSGRLRLNVREDC